MLCPAVMPREQTNVVRVVMTHGPHLDQCSMHRFLSWTIRSRLVCPPGVVSTRLESRITPRGVPGGPKNILENFQKYHETPPPPAKFHEVTAAAEPW